MGASIGGVPRMRSVAFTCLFSATTPCTSARLTFLLIRLYVTKNTKDPK